MLFNFKSVVHSLKLVTYLFLSRSFDNIIHDIAEKYEHIELKMTEELWNYICCLILKVSFIFLNEDDRRTVEIYMLFNFKSVVHFLKLVTYLLLFRSFDNIIHDIGREI